MDEMRTDRRNVLTVTQLNTCIKTLIEGADFLRSVYIKGEISNFTNHYKTGHFYFTLKDEGSLLKAVMFRASASRGFSCATSPLSDIIRRLFCAL